MPSNGSMSVAEAVERAAEESRGAAAGRSQQVVKLDNEINALRRAQGNISAQISALETHREEMVRQKTAVQHMVRERAQKAIFDALQQQQQALFTRAAEVSAMQGRVEENWVAELEQSSLAAEFEEYRQFKTEIEPTLSSLPASYRSVVVRHHHQVVQRLRELYERVLSAPVEVEAEQVVLDVVVSLDPFEDDQLAMIAVLPVSGTLASGWSERPDDLESAVAYRVVQGIYTALKGTPMQTRQLIVGEHQDLLILEMDMVFAGEVADFSARLIDQIETALSGAPELRGAQIATGVCVIDVETLLPSSFELPAEDAPTERVAEGDELYVG